MSSLRESNTKNGECFLPDDTINIKNLDFDRILVQEKPCHSIFIYHVAHKTPRDEINLRIEISVTRICLNEASS